LKTSSNSPKLSVPKKGQLFQERLKYNPFWMLVACQLVNLTNWEGQAEPAFQYILARHLTPESLAEAEAETLHEILKPLGLWRRRAITLPKFARAWLQGKPECYDDVLKMPGCGKYSADSWAIFVDGRLDIQPNDGKLNWYIDRRQCDDLRQNA